MADSFDVHLKAAREQNVPVEVILERLEQMARSKHDWIERFSQGRNKRPDHEITVALLSFSVLVHARDKIAANRSQQNGAGHDAA